MPKKLKKCHVCSTYTLKDEHCKSKTKDAHYKFLKIRNAVRTASLVPQAE